MRYRVPELPLSSWQTTDIEVEKSHFITWTCHASDIDAFTRMLAAAKAITARPILLAHPASKI